jgi:hypothetical protein
MKWKISLAMLAFALLAGTVSFAAAQDRRYDDDDGYRSQRYDSDDYRHDFREGGKRAWEFGYQDGIEVAREDSGRGKRFNPYPRGHNHRDRGYGPEFGSLHEYRENYTRAYHQGYEHGYQSNGSGYYR